MNRRVTYATSLATATGLLLMSPMLHAQDSDDFFGLGALLSGAQEVVPPDAPTTPSPGVQTAASGTIQIAVAADFSGLQFQLTVMNATGVTQAHLHCARPGENGPVILFLSPLNEQGADVNGVLAEGTRVNTDLEPGATACEELIGMPVRNIASLTAAAFAGLIYANVHTVTNPAGEIRGQLVPLSDDIAATAGAVRPTR
jgi:hypothetical protein